MDKLIYSDGMREIPSMKMNTPEPLNSVNSDDVKMVLKDLVDASEKSTNGVNTDAEAFMDVSSCSSLSQESLLVSNGATTVDSRMNSRDTSVPVEQIDCQEENCNGRKLTTKRDDGIDNTNKNKALIQQTDAEPAVQLKQENGDYHDDEVDCDMNGDSSVVVLNSSLDDDSKELLLEDLKQPVVPVPISSPLNLSAKPAEDEADQSTISSVKSDESAVKSEAVVDKSDDDEPQVLDLSRHDRQPDEMNTEELDQSADEKSVDASMKREVEQTEHWRSSSELPERRHIERGHSDSRTSSPLSDRRLQKLKPKQPVDNVRPTARLLYDLGLDLVRQEVYKDLIDIQETKDREQRLDEKEKNQLIKLTEAHTRLKVKNSPYSLQRLRCRRCKFSCTSTIVESLHLEFGHFSQNTVHVCCICDTFHSRYPSQFIMHMESLHQMNARITKKLLPAMCAFCSYEHKNAVKVELHVSKCSKKFQLSCNLQPMPPDCDIPIRQRAMQWQPRPPGSQYGTGAGQSYSTQAGPRFSPSAVSSAQSSVMEIGGQLYSWSSYRGKPLLTSLRSQVGNSFGSTSSPANTTQAAASSAMSAVSIPSIRNSTASGNMSSKVLAQLASQLKQESCEICGATVASRQALWTHFQTAHKFETSRVSNEPSIFCDICKAKFWTYQGLARHSLQQHKKVILPNAGRLSAGSQRPSLSPAQRAPPGQRASQPPHRSAFKCHFCGMVQMINPLNHLSSNHNITLLDMYHSCHCCMCNRKLRSKQAFEEHMVFEHKDIFANQDVLMTVLQALSTALNLKSDGAHQRPAASGQNSQARSGLYPQPLRLATSQRMSTPVSRQPANMYTGSNSWPRQKSQNAAAANSHPHSSTAALMMSKFLSSGNQPSSAGSKKVRVKPPVAEQLTPIKPPVDKKAAEADVKALNKLYQDYADLGRPISRSMKQRLLSSSGKSTADDREGKPEHDESCPRENEKRKHCSNDSNDAREVETESKKTRLESTEEIKAEESVTAS